MCRGPNPRRRHPPTASPDTTALSGVLALLLIFTTITMVMADAETSAAESTSPNQKLPTAWQQPSTSQLERKASEAVPDRSEMVSSLSAWYNSKHKTPSLCFSCMDHELQYHWYKLQHIYIQPLNFTRHCRDLKGSVQSVACEMGSACVTIVEPQYMAGFRIGESVIRGCSDRVFLDGPIPKEALCTKFPLTAARCASCQSVSAAQLMPSATHVVSKSSREWLVCSCVGQNCNQVPTFKPPQPEPDEVGNGATTTIGFIVNATANSGSDNNRSWTQWLRGRRRTGARLGTAAVQLAVALAALQYVHVHLLL